MPVGYKKIFSVHARLMTLELVSKFAVQPLACFILFCKIVRNKKVTIV